MRLLAASFLALFGLSSVPSRAEASFLIVEMNTGFATSAYEAGPIGLAYGGSIGATVRYNPLPFRFYFLGTIAARNATADGLHQGIPTSAERRDLDLYVAERTLLPIYGPFRLYGEIGVGERFMKETIRRGDLGPLSASGSEMIVVLAAGAELRFTDMFSFGLRAEVMPLPSDLDLAHYAADFAPRSTRTAFMGQLGVHF